MAQTFRDIIAFWPSPDALAAELGAKPETVRKWRQRNRIPANRWLAVIRAAKKGGVDLTAEEMAGLTERRL